MLPSRDLHQALLDLPLSSEVGPWTRVVKYRLLRSAPPGAPPESPPQPLWPGGPKLTGTRFTPQGDFGSIYLASDAMTSLREVSAVFEGAGTFRTPPWTVFAVDGFLSAVLDLTDAAVHQRLGTSLAELTGDWLLSQELYRQHLSPIPPTQLLAKVAHGTGRVVAMRYRSARNIWGGTNLVVFADRLAPESGNHLQVYDPDGLISQHLP